MRSYIKSLCAVFLLSISTLSLAYNAAKWPEKALVGYVTAYARGATPPATTNAMITAALSHHYNVFVYSFGYIDAKNSVTFPTPISDANLKTQISNIHSQGGVVLLSFGGQNNTFKPDSDSKSAIPAAVNTATLLKKYNFDGIDLDVEKIVVDDQYLLDYIKTLRDQYTNIIITAAPQIAGGWGGPAQLAPTTIFTLDFLQNANFTALLIQEYNQAGGAKFNNLEDTDVGFITASFAPLTALVPYKTKIIIGEPATTVAGTGLSNPADVVTDLESGDVLSHSQYGGIMVWAINYDADQGWSFADGVHTVTVAQPTATNK